MSNVFVRRYHSSVFLGDVCLLEDITPMYLLEDIIPMYLLENIIPMCVCYEISFQYVC